MKLISCLMLILAYLNYTVNSYAQTGTFETHIDPDIGSNNNNAVAVRAVSDGMIICSVSGCPDSSPCLDIVKTDWAGNLIWKNNIESPFNEIRFSLESCTATSDSGFYTMSGKFVDGNRQFIISYFDNDGSELWCKDYGTEDKESGLGGIIQAENEHLLAYCSTGIDWVFAKVMFTKLNKQGDIIWQKIHSVDIDTLPFSRAHHFTQSTTGDYLFTVETPLPPPEFGTQKTLAHVFATDTAGNPKWQFTLNDTRIYDCAAFIAPLPNGNLAVSWCNDTIIGAWGQNYGIPHFVAGMDTAGNTLWQHYFAAPYQKKINRLRRASNGDIIGCGGTNNPAAGFYQGWLFRFSPQGQLLWEREYYHPPIGSSITALGSSFNDLTETPDGGIAATGFFRSQTEIDIWLVKTDADGCMEPGCNDSLIWLSAAEAAEGFWVGKPLHALSVYPNPASSHITIHIPPKAVAHTPAPITLYNLYGQQVLTHPLLPGQNVATIDLPPLPKGIYLVHLQGQQHSLSAKLAIE